MDYEALAKKYGGSPAEVKGRPDDIDALAKQFGGKLTSSAEPESRNLFYVANDTVIAIANAAASGVKAAADFVSPGNSFSKAIDEFVKKGEESQSDIVKAAREKYAQDMEEAKGFMEEVSATGKYLAGSPLQAAGMALGSFAGPGLAIKGATKGAQLLNASEKVASRLGLGTGVVTGAAMSGGDAAGSAYEMVMQTPDDILMQNDLIKSQVEAGRSLEEIKQEAATTAARRASVIPALIGGVSGAFGVERILAGMGGKEAAKSLSAAAIKSGLTEAIQEGIEEGATEYSARAAAQTYDPRIDPMKGVAGAATMGAVLGAIPGAAIGALDASRRIQADELQRDLEAARAAYEQEAATTEKAAEEQAAKITETAAPVAEGEVAIPTFTPLQVGQLELDLGETRAEQPTGTVARAGEPSAEGAARELGTAPGEPVAPVAARVEPTGGPAELPVSGEGAQRAALEEAVPLTPEIEVAAKQLYDTYAAQQIEAGVPSVLPWESLGESTKQEFYNQVAGTEVQVAEPTVTERAPVDLLAPVGQPVVEAKEEPTVEPVAEAVPAAPAEVAEEQAPTEVAEPVEKKEYAATERVFSKEQMPFITAKVQDRAAVPRTVDEAANYAAAETAFDFFDSADKAVNQELATQAKEQGKTVEEVAAALPENQLFQMYYDNVNTENLNAARQKQITARDSFIKTLSKDQQEVVRKKAIEAFHAEIRAKRAGKQVTEADKRKARQKTYDEAAAKRAKRAEEKVKKEVKETEKQIKKLETTEKKKTPEEIREEKVKAALKSGSGYQVAAAIVSGYDPKKSKLIDNISQAFAHRLAYLMGEFDHEPEIVIGKVEGNRPGKYDPETETITIDPNAPRDVPLEAVILHELTHYAADRMIDNYDKLTPEQKRNINELNKLHKHVRAFLGEKYEIPTLKEFVAEAFSNTKFQLDMAGLPPLKNKSVINEFAIRIMSLLGFRDREINQVSVLGNVISNIDKLILGPRRGDAKEVSYAPKAAEGVKDNSFEALKKSMPSPVPTSAMQRVKTLLTTKRGGQELIRKYQNRRERVYRWQSNLMAQKRLTIYSDDFDNIATQLTLAAGNAKAAFLEELYVPTEKLREAIDSYANEYRLSTEEAVKELDLIAMERHHNERREVLYLLKAPLRNDTAILQDSSGNPITPYQAREKIFEFLNTRTKKDFKSSAAYDQAIKDLRKGLEALVNDKNNLDPKKKDIWDINTTHYDVAGALSPEQLENIRKEYERKKSMVDPVLANLREVNKKTKEVNKKANYWSGYVDNWANFYGWDNYVPLKGKALSPIEKDNEDLLDFESRKLAGELQDDPNTMQGRVSMPESPVLRVMAEGAKAAIRLGNRDVTTAVYNAVEKTKTLNGTTKILNFNERTTDKLEDYRKPSNIFHHMEDGRVAIITIKDPDMVQAIRDTNREIHPLWDTLNAWTSLFGQQHTRYNLAFAPINFARDILTNTYLLGAELGAKQSARYIKSIAAGIAGGEQYKVGVFSHHFAKGDKAKIQSLIANDKSGYYKDLYDYIKIGGRVSYIEGITAKGQYSELLKGVGGGVIANTKAKIDKVMDLWIDSFELTARVAAYRLAKSNIKAELLRSGVNEKEAELAATKEGAAYAKNLANFEQIGELGKQMGAWFMYFRPAATGVVRTVQAFAPAFMNVEQAKLRMPEYAEMLNLRQELKTNKYEGKKLEEKQNRLKELEKGLDNFVKTYSERKANARLMMGVIAGIGMAAYYMSKMMADDDDLGRNKTSTDDMSRWTRNARFFIPGFDTIIQIPWGYGAGAFAALGAQIASIGDSNTDLKDTLGNIITIGLDSFMPIPVARINPLEKPIEATLDSLAPSILRPFVEFAFNLDGLGRQIYNDRNSRYADAYTGGDNIPEVYKIAARNWFDSTTMDVSPNILYFFANNYVDGISRTLLQAPVSTYLWLSGDKDFDWKHDTLFLNSFIGSKSNFDARQWSKIEDDLKERQKIVNALKENNPVRYASYLAAHPLDEMLVEMYNQDVNGHLRDLRAEANQFRAMEGLSTRDKKAIVDAIVLQQNLEKFRLVQLYKAMGVEP
jgi:hypothetical protein